MAIVAAIAIPQMLKGRTAGSETSVISCLRTLIAANRKYHSRFRTYAGSLTDLFDEGYIDSVFVSGLAGATVGAAGVDRRNRRVAAQHTVDGTRPRE